MDCLITCVYSLRCWNLNLHFLNVKPNIILDWEVVWHTMFVFNETSTFKTSSLELNILDLFNATQYLVKLVLSWYKSAYNNEWKKHNVDRFYVQIHIIYFKWTIFRLVLLCVIDMLNENKIDISCRL